MSEKLVLILEISFVFVVFIAGAVVIVYDIKKGDKQAKGDARANLYLISGIIVLTVLPIVLFYLMQ